MTFIIRGISTVMTVSSRFDNRGDAARGVFAQAAGRPARQCGGAQSALPQAADLQMSQPPSVVPSPRPDCGPKIAAAVFFDPAKKRWPRLRLGMLLVGVDLTLLLGGLLLSILAAPVLPALHLPTAGFLPHGAHAVPDIPALAPEQPTTRRERVLRNEQLKLARERERTLRHLLQPACANAADVDHQPLAIGFFVNWDDASMSSLKENLGSLDTVIAEWLHLVCAARGRTRRTAKLVTPRMAVIKVTGLVALGGLIFGCGLPGWAIVRWVFNFIEKNRDFGDR
ncbi:MAG: hypothetical protein V5B40_10215 [Candidatus Accumulibacter meliphilus]|jgi:hypothetical protein|uniref:hypothetical protein n=1 Tax=Candidatus Accumulibacter meliphilus TaxID=2211374 RepID=UPI002FC3C8AA